MKEKSFNLFPIYHLFTSLCLSTSCYGSCDSANCMMSYWFKVLEDINRSERPDFVLTKDEAHLPYGDTKTYNKDLVLRCQSLVLSQCANCKQDHDDNCIINVLRNSLHYCITSQEDEQFKYKGMTSQYTKYLSEINHDNGRELRQYCRTCKIAPEEIFLRAFSPF